MKDILNTYLENTVEMRAMLTQRTPGEAAYDKEVVNGLKKGWPIRKALKRAAEKHPDEAFQWSEDQLADIRDRYEWLLEHEEIMAKAKAMGFKKEIRFFPPQSNTAGEADAGGYAPGISFIAIDSILEKRLATERCLAEKLAEKGKGCLRFGRAMNDEQLIQKLHSLGVSLDKAAFTDLRKSFLSAQELALALVRDRKLTFKGVEENWLWVCLAVLWERWASDAPSLEMIDDAMQQGYKRSDEDDMEGAIGVWFEVWKNVTAIMDSRGMRTLSEFDAAFRGSQAVSNWVQDVETELLNACWQTGARCEDRIRFCREVIDRSAGDDSMIENMRRAIGDSYASMGDTKQADSLFDGWLKADPEWGWGWIGWSDSHGLFKKGEKNWSRAEDILKQGLAIHGVRDRDDILERLMRIYEETGRREDAVRIREELGMPDEELLEDVEWAETTDVSCLRQAPPPPASSRKIGRNEPCPCGSGKKYKKCCGG